MPQYQLDECLNDPVFARECEQTAAANSLTAEVKLLPRELKGKADPEVLEKLLPLGRAILTKDRRIARDHPDSLHPGHPGIVIVASVLPGTITVKIVKKILSAFKGGFPQWSQTDLSNSIVEITQEGVDVHSVSGSAYQRDRYIGFQESGWQQILTGVLQTNASRATCLPR